MTRISDGSTVTFRYIGTLDDGRIFDSSEGAGPLTITVGSGQLFPALEQALVGMKTGEAKNIVLTAEQAYGSRSTDNILRVSRTMFPAAQQIIVGQKLSIEFRSGVSRVMLVSAVSDQEVTLDGNHPLAGLELTFALQVDRVE